MRTRTSRGRSPWKRCAVWAAVMSTGVPTVCVGATTRTWAAGNGTWTGVGGTGSNWSSPIGPGVPADGDTVMFANTDGVARTITYDYTGPAVTLPLLVVDLKGGLPDATATLSMGANNLTAATEYIGYSGAVDSHGSGTFIQSGGVNTITATGNGFYLAVNSTDQGFYTLSGGSLVANNAESVGYAGAGTFTQSGGTHTINAGLNFFYVGLLQNSTGLYYLNGTGVFTSNASEYIGHTGSGGFFQDAGSNTITAGHDLYVAFAAMSFGGYTLNGGGLTVNGNEYVGYNGNGTFNQGGGSNVVAGGNSLYIAPVANSIGSYQLDGGSLQVSGKILVGGTTVIPGGTGTLVINSVNTLTTTNGITVWSGGTLGGRGSTSAAVTVIGGSVQPGSLNSQPGPAGTLTVAALTIGVGVGARLEFDTGDKIAVTGNNGFNVSNQAAVVLRATNGPFVSGTTLITYSGNLVGSLSNLRPAGGSVGVTYTLVNDAANHAIKLVASNPFGTATPIVVTGQIAPGGPGGDFNSIAQYPQINDAGQVTFDGSFFNASDGSSYGIFRGDGSGPLVAIVRQNQTAPGAGIGQIGSQISTATLTLNAGGQVACYTDIVGAFDGSARGIFRGDGTTLVAIAREKQVAPGAGGGTFSPNGLFFTIRSDFPAGPQVPFVANITGSTDGSTSGVFRGDGVTQLVPLARHKQAAPGAGGGVFGGFGDISEVNQSQEVAFTAVLTGTTDSSSRGVFVSDGITPILSVARQKDPAPGAGGGFFGTNPQLPTINNFLQVAFKSDITGSGDGSTTGLFIGNGFSPPLAIARDKQPAPGAGAGTFSALNGGFSDLRLGAMSVLSFNRVAFTAALAGTNDGSTQGIFRGDGSTVVQMTRNSLPVPGSGGGTFSTFSLAAMLPGGQVTFGATITGSAGGTSDNTGLFITDGTETVALVRQGQTIGDATITILNINFLSGNNLGQIATTVGLSTPAAAVFVFTPVLHWRTALGGDWDTSGNWTVGLAPAAPYDVFIDLPTPLLVGGPLADTTVKSLTVGSGGAAAQLQLISSSTMTVTGALTVAADGSSVVFAHGGLNVATLAAATGSVSWTSGDLTIRSGGLTVDPSGPVGAAIVVTTGKNLTVGGIVQLNAGGSLTQTGAGAFAAGSLTQTGGTLTLPSLVIGAGGMGPAVVSSTFTFSAGVATIPVITLLPGGTLLQSGASLSVSMSFTQAGGDYSGGALTIPPTAAYTYSGGGFAGQLVNQGTANINANFTAGNGLTNSGLATLADGVTATFNGAGFTNSAGGLLQAQSAHVALGGAMNNAGAVSLAGGLISGPAILTNAGGGLIGGYGTISAPLTNSAGAALIAQGGTLAITSPFSNAGTIELVPGGAISGGTITNNGAVVGAGAISSGIINNSTVEAVGGVLLLTSPANTNSGTGSFTVTTGNQIRILAGVASNPGAIILAGGTFDKSGPMTNTGNGSITGFGVLRTGGLTNNGTIAFAGGPTRVDGPLTNSAGRSLTVSIQPAVFTGAVINNGAFVFPDASVTFTGSYTSSSTLIAGPITNSGAFSQSGTATYSGNFTNSGGTATLGGSQAWTNGTQLNAAGGAVTLASDPGSTAAYNLIVQVTPAAGSATLHIASHAGDQVHLRNLQVNAVNTGGAGLLIIDAAVTGPGNSTTHFGAVGGSVAVYLGNGAGGSGVASRATIENLWRSAALEGYWALQNHLVAAITRGLTLDPAVVTDATKNGLVVLPSVDEANHPVTYVGEDIQGDANGDGKVDVNDVGVVLQHLNTTPGTLVGETGYTIYTPAEGDVNGDLQADVNDLAAVLAHLNQTYAPSASSGVVHDVPEPASLLPILLGTTGLLRRRRVNP